MDIKVAAIYTNFKHHGTDAGYKQILKYINPVKVLGINQMDPLSMQSKSFLVEFELYKYRNEFNLLHILYAEDYFKWSTRLFPQKPIVATFHQPLDILEQDILTGYFSGKVGRISHFFNKNRFEKLGAAIVTNLSQISALEKVMPREKIHCIPLGIHLDKMSSLFENHLATMSMTDSKIARIITVGNWQRDWDFYFSVVAKCPQWHFSLVNRRLEEKYKKIAQQYSNLTFFDDITDDALYQLFLNSNLQLLPVKAIAGSNALLQGLALGCPLVLTDIHTDPFRHEKDCIKCYQKGNLEECIHQMEMFIHLSIEQLLKYKRKAHDYNQDSWATVAKKTIEIYKQLI